MCLLGFIMASVVVLLVYIYLTQPKSLLDASQPNTSEDFYTVTTYSDPAVLTDMVAQLTDLQPSCLSGALTSLNLVDDGSGGTVYETECRMSGTNKFTRGNSSSTPWNVYSSTSARYLDRHSINCGDQAIRDFKLEVNPLDTRYMRYIYSCTKPPTPLTQCTALSSAKSTYPNGSQSPTILKNKKVSCPSGQLMSNLRFRSDASNYWYDYTCCQ